MVDKIIAVKGTHDILADKMPLWQQLEAKLRQLTLQYAYQEIRTPVFENTQLFKRSIGALTDIVDKEMFKVASKNSTDDWSLRPEGTASVVRACLEHALLRHGQVQKFWYQGPMFRYERPQKGRFRQFHQFGLEVYNVATIGAELEIIEFMHNLWQQLKVSSAVRLQINSLGNTCSRLAYKKALTTYLEANFSKLDADSQRRLTSNPLRVLDSKDPNTQQLLQQAPSILDYLDSAANQEFAHLQDQLMQMQIPFEVNDKLVRGLDYYNSCVFEWVTNSLGAQNSVCGGGRYDTLAASLDAENIPACGCAVGIERLLLLMEQTGATEPAPLDAYLICTGQALLNIGHLSAKIRKLVPNIKMYTAINTASFKAQFKKADKSGAKLALIIGDDEYATNTVSVKYLRHTAEQININIDAIGSIFKEIL